MATNVYKPKATYYKLPEDALKKLLKRPPVRPLVPAAGTARQLPWLAGGLKIKRKLI